MDITNRAIEAFGRDKFNQMAQQFNSMSQSERDELFRKVKAMPQEQFFQYFKSKGIDIQAPKANAQSTNRRFNY